MSLFLNFFRRLTRHIVRSDLITVSGLMLILIMVGTVAYAQLEGWSWLDALYATIITMTTVGYGDLTPQTEGGRIFAIFFTFIAIGVGGYGISTLAAYMIENRLVKKAKLLGKRRMKRIEKLQNHYIVCGADLVGTRIAEEFYQTNTPYIIIDADESQLKNALLFSHPDYFKRKLSSLVDVGEVDLSRYEDRTLAELGEMLETPYLLADPTDDNSLVKAGLDRAQGLIAALPDDRDNLAIVVGARALAQRFNNTTLRIMARVEDSRFMRKLYLSGADYVRLPAVASGHEMALHMMHPEIGLWWYKILGVNKSNKPRLQEISLHHYPTWVGQSITQLHQNQQIVTLAIKRGQEFLSPPAADLHLEADDLLIVLAQGNQLDKV
jgi:voltage-gated potassium channel